MSVANQVHTLPAEADLAAALRELESLSSDELRVRWRRSFRQNPPELPRGLMLRILAYRLQARMLGDLSPEASRYLDQIARDRLRRMASPERPSRSKSPPPVPPVPKLRGIRPGALIAREWGGRMHKVEVISGGFRYGGQTYRSLSEIARLITGTRWNGPRFFGLRSSAPGTDSEDAAS